MHIKENGNHKVKRQPTKWDKTFIKYSPDTGLILRIYEECKKYYNKTMKTLINIWT